MAMLPEIFSTYYHQHHQNVMVGVMRTLEAPTHEHFHDLRVSLKRIRFIGKTLKRYGVRKSNKYFKPYTRLFRLAGTIREYQVHTYLIGKLQAEYEDESSPRRFVKKERKLIQSWPENAMGNLHKIILAYIPIQKSINRWSITLPDYLDGLQEWFNDWFNEEIPDKHLHRSRKVLKAMVYSGELSPEIRKAIGRFCNLKAALKLEDAIGDWHDLELLLDQHEKNKDENVERKLKREKKRERIKINRLIPQLAPKKQAVR
jgi:CHAD domain-containing protein